MPDLVRASCRYGNTLTLTGFDGASHTVAVTGQTRYQKAGASAALSDVTTGTAIVAEGTLGSNGTLTAVRVCLAVQLDEAHPWQIHREVPRPAPSS
jgi:hypothetical protein